MHWFAFCLLSTSTPVHALFSIIATYSVTTELLNHMRRVQQLLFVPPKFIPSVQTSLFANFCHVLHFSHFSHTLEASILLLPLTGLEALKAVTEACWTYHILKKNVITAYNQVLLLEMEERNRKEEVGKEKRTWDHGWWLKRRMWKGREENQMFLLILQEKEHLGSKWHCYHPR